MTRSLSPDPTGPEIEEQIAHPQQKVLRRLLAAQAQPYAGQQFVEGERLDHVVVGAALQARHDVAHAVARGEDDDGQGDTRLPQLAQYGQPVVPGEAEVEYEEVEVAAPGLLVGGDAVGDDPGDVSATAQAFFDEGSDSCLVLGYQDPAH